MIQPFRLINAAELSRLIHHITTVINTWNSEYSCIPLTFELIPATTLELDNTIEVYEDNQCLAVLQEDYLLLFNNSLFGTNQSCFNSVSKDLCVLLLQNLFHRTPITIERKNQKSLHWIYKGSPCLSLNLISHDKKITMIISPNWVHQFLSLNKTVNQALVPLETAMSPEPVHLDVQLDTIKLSLKQIINLQVGDFITLDHPVNKELQLCLNQKKQSIAQVELGKIATQKSIIIKRSV